MFAQRLAGHSVARITRALNDAGIPCPSAADPGRNPHRSGAGRTPRTVAAILANPRYTGRQVWNRQRTDFDLVDPANTGLGHRQVQRWNLPEGRPDPGRPKNTYVREDQILPHLAALAILLAGDGQARDLGTIQVTTAGQTADLIDQLRASGAVLTYNPDTQTIRAVGSNSVGAFAERALRLRGLPPDDTDVPASARAVLVAGELEEVSRAAFLAHRMAGTDPGSDPWLPPELKEAFDHAADGWPGGAAALLAAIAGAAPGTFALLAGPLSQHPDPAVAHAARRARLAAQAAVTIPRRKNKTKARSARPRKSGGRRHR